MFERVKPVFEALGKTLFSARAERRRTNCEARDEFDPGARSGSAGRSACAGNRKAGIAGEKLVEVMQSSMARAGVLDVKAPSMLKNEFPASFPLRLMHKDIRLALELASNEGLTLPAAAAAYCNLWRGERIFEGRSRLRCGCALLEKPLLAGITAQPPAGKN